MAQTRGWKTCHWFDMTKPGMLLPLGTPDAMPVASLSAKPTKMVLWLWEVGRRYKEGGACKGGGLGADTWVEDLPLVY